MIYYYIVALYGYAVFAYIELPLIRRQQLQGTVEVSDLNAENFVSNNDSTAMGLCFLSLDLKNCSSQDNLGTVVGLGTPTQTFHVQLQFFTDSLWVFDWSCKITGCGSEMPKSLFDRSLSKTFVNTKNNQITIRHQNFKLPAIQVVDIATLGNATWPLNFGLIQRAPYSMDIEYDGIMGVGPSHSKQGLLNILLANETQKVVTIFIRDSIKKRGQDDGRLTLGHLDNRHCAPEWQYVRLESERNWKVIAKSILLGNTTILGTNHEVRLNPGSLITFAPKWIAADLHERLGARRHQNGNIFVVRNSDLKKLPKIKFDFGGAVVELDSEHYTAKLPILSEDLRVVTIHGFYETPTWQLGDDFYRLYCTALDLENGRIGFSRHSKKQPKEDFKSKVENSTPKMTIFSWLIISNVIIIMGL